MQCIRFSPKQILVNIRCHTSALAVLSVNLDVGSATVKLVVINDEQVLHDLCILHFCDVANTLQKVLHECCTHECCTLFLMHVCPPSPP